MRFWNATFPVLWFHHMEVNNEDYLEDTLQMTSVATSSAPQPPPFPYSYPLSPPPLQFSLLCPSHHSSVGNLSVGYTLVTWIYESKVNIYSFPRRCIPIINKSLSSIYLHNSDRLHVTGLFQGPDGIYVVTIVSRWNGHERGRTQLRGDWDIS